MHPLSTADESLSPSIPTVASDLSVRYTRTVHVGSRFTVWLQIDGSITLLSCDVPTGGSVCSDSTHTVAIPAGSRLEFFIGDSLGFNSLNGDVLIGWRDSH